LLWTWHHDDSNFSIKSIVSDDNGKFSLSKTGQFVSMLVSTWVIVYQTNHGVLTEWLFTGYMLAWAGANAYKQYLSTKTNPSGTNPPAQ